MTSAGHNSLPAYAIAVAGIALFSIMDMLMKGLTLAIGTYPTLFWRSLIGILLTVGPYFFVRKGWPARMISGTAELLIRASAGDRQI